MSSSSPGTKGERTGIETDGSGVDVVLDALSHERRRLLIDTLYEDGGGSFSEVVDGVSRRAYGRDYSPQERKRIYVSLYQNHVPKLVEAGFVVFEGTKDDERIYAGPRFRQAKDSLTAIRSSVNESSMFRPLSDLLSA